ncbi:MAG: hypothetical protein J7K47_06780 [Thermoplasmata archaeon]|nr:hypothetical protein [Thermoplasmata archaeon]
MKELIEKAIGNILTDYKKNEKRYTTEGDVVAHLFCELQKVFKKKEEIILHSQVRPFDKDKESKVRVIKEGKWIEQPQANAGSVVDLAILTMGENDKYWEIAFEKAMKDQYKNKYKNKNGLKYWRILSYPVEAFLAAIEIKVRVDNNKKRIFEDIDKLHCLKSKNPNCLTYMLVLDRYASKNILRSIEERAEEKEVPLRKM